MTAARRMGSTWNPCKQKAHTTTIIHFMFSTNYVLKIKKKLRKRSVFLIWVIKKAIDFSVCEWIPDYNKPSFL